MVRADADPALLRAPRRPSRRVRSGLPGPTGGHRRGGSHLPARRPHPRCGLHPRGGRGLASCVLAARPQARDVRLPRLPPRRRGGDPAGRPGAPAPRGRRPGPLAHRVPHRAGARARAHARVLRLAGRPGVPLDAVHPPPLGALLHTRARHRPRDHRARQHAREPGVRRPVPAGRAGVPAGGVRRRPRLLLEGVLVHPRVRRRVGGRRGCAPTAPGCCRRTARSRSSGGPRSAPGTSAGWAPSTTTSPVTSRCCSRPSRSIAWSTTSGRSSPGTTRTTSPGARPARA